MHLHLVTHVDVAIDQDVFVGRHQTQQADFGCAQVTGFNLADHTFDEDAVGGVDPDGAASGSVQGAARDAFVRAVQHQRFNQHGHTALVGASRYLQLIMGGDQTIDQQLRAGLDEDVRTGIAGRDCTAQLDIAIAVDLYGTTGQGWTRPSAGGAVEAAGGVGPDGAARRHPDAHAGVVRTGVDGDRAGGRNTAPLGAAAQNKAFSGTHVDGGALARPSQLRRNDVVGVAVVGRDQGGPSTQCTQHRDLSSGQGHQAVVALGLHDHIAAHHQAVACSQDELASGRQHTAAAAVQRAQAEVALSTHLQALGGCCGGQAQFRRCDVAPGLHVDRTGQIEAAAQHDVAGRFDGDLVVKGGRRGQAALDHTQYVDVLTAQGHQGTGFQPTAALSQCQAAVGGADVESAQARVAATDDAVDHHVVQAGQNNAPACVTGEQFAAACGFQADLADAHAGLGAGVDDDVALGLQAALDFHGLFGVDDDVGIAPQSHQLTLQHRMPSRTQDHATAERLQAAAGAEQHILRARGSRQGVELNRGVRTHIAGHRDRTSFQVGVANEYLGAALAGVDGGQSCRGGGPKRSVGVCNLTQTQTLGAAAGHAAQAEVEASGDQLQTAFEQAHTNLLFGHVERAIDGRLHIGHQAQQVGVVCGCNR